MTTPWRVHGLSLSYFTGKIEAYLRAKGQPYELIEMTAADLRACAAATGVAWMPQIETPDGWLTDTPRIIEHLERVHAGPAITPADPLAAFIAGLIEDFGDEQLWRPALYYRWAHAADARLRGQQIADAMLGDLPFPRWVKRWLIIRRQRRVYLPGDGVTAANAEAVRREYLEVLDALEPVLARRPFVMGQRPTEADFGLFGGLFRHFAQDPTPAAIMRGRAPSVLAWTERQWTLAPGDFAAEPQPAEIPEGLEPLARAIAGRFLPMMAAHEEAWTAGADQARFEQFGAAFRTSVSPYRVSRLARLRNRFQALDAVAKSRAADWLGDAEAVACLERPESPRPPPEPLSLPIASGRRLDSAPRDRQWRRA
ncbi:MAG: glutathione S-transferase [Caulobacter sp.]|nr:glutathione S-transferase [Caulobacter sp.]